MNIYLKKPSAYYTLIGHGPSTTRRCSSILVRLTTASYVLIASALILTVKTPWFIKIVLIGCWGFSLKASMKNVLTLQYRVKSLSLNIYTYNAIYFNLYTNSTSNTTHIAFSDQMMVKEFNLLSIGLISIKCFSIYVLTQF